MIKQNKFVSHFDITADQKLQFSNIRNKIDNIDNKIIDLLTERTNIIKEAKELKTSFYPEDKCFITPGREASMMKEIISKAQKIGLPSGAIFGIWRNIISASTSLENPLILNILTKTNNSEYLTDITEYFGKYTKTNFYQSTEENLEHTSNINNSIAILPYQSNWWELLYKDFAKLKIFGILPFLQQQKNQQQQEKSVLIANILPEPTDQDITLFVCESNIKDNLDQYSIIAENNNKYLLQQDFFSLASSTEILNIGSYSTPIKI
jgi:chorismate mutase